MARQRRTRPRQQRAAHAMPLSRKSAKASSVQAKPSSSSRVQDRPPVSPALSSLAAIGLLGAGVWSYWPTLTFMVDEWLRKADYSHGFLVVPIALFFAWERRSALPFQELGPAAAGLILLIGATAIRYFAAGYNMEVLDAWTIPVWVAGAVWLLYGLSCLRWCLPSVLFLYFMIPLPYSAEQWLSRPLQGIATHLSTGVLQMLGQPAVSEGNTIWLGEQQMEVAQACSGLRIFVAIVAMAFAFVLFSRWNWWQKLIVLVSVPPVAILANLTRIVGTGLLYQFSTTEAAHTFSHDISGYMMIPLAALLFWFLLMYLDKLFPPFVDVSAVDLARKT